MAEIAEKSKSEDASAGAKVESKSDVRPRKLCAYSQRVCNLEILKGFDFCHKHILEDKASPFKPCDFVAKSNGRRCPNPAQKLPDRAKSFCIIHTRKAELRRAVEERRKRRHQDDVEGSYDDEKGKRRRTSSSNSQKSDKIDGHSSDEDGGGSGDDYLKVDSAFHGDIDSDAESVDSEEEDLLKHAGVWTVEEATRMCRDKMIKLRSLYISQFKRLQHVLKERRRKYCQAIQAEEVEEIGECHLTPSQLLGRKPRHGCPGVEALLRQQAKEKKQGTNTRQQTMSTQRCTYSPGGNRCTEKVLPLTKHCMKHITHDPNQLLFQRCTFQSKGDNQCEKNVAKIFTHSACRLHMELPTNMKRPDVSKDLTDAKERAKLRKARMIDNNESEADVPEAIQQKSSALVPPTTSGQLDVSGPATTEPQQAASAIAAEAATGNATASSQPSTQSSITPSTGPEKMEVDDNDKKPDDDSKKLSSNSTASVMDTSPSASSSAASGPKPGLASESISPVLAAASLVAVCSSPQVPLQGTPLASVSGSQQSSLTDSKSVLSKSDKEQSVSATAPDASKVDADSKAPDVKPEGDATNIKEAEKKVSLDLKSTTTTLSEKTTPSDTNTTASGTSQRPVSPPKQPEQIKVTLNVSSRPKEETKAPISTSPSVSQTTTQSTPTQATPSNVTSTPSTSLNTTPQIVTKSLSMESSEKPSKVTSKSASQGALSAVPHEPQKTSPQGTPPGTPTVSKQTPLAITLSSVHPAQSTTASTSAGQALKTISAKPMVTSETHRPAPIKTFQHLPAGMTAASSKQFSSVIPSVSSKEANKESSKADPVKSQEPSNLPKL